MSVTVCDAESVAKVSVMSVMSVTSVGAQGGGSSFTLIHFNTPFRSCFTKCFNSCPEIVRAILSRRF